MEEIRYLVWNGSINVQVEVDSPMFIEGVPDSNKRIKFWVPRNCYITSCLNSVLRQVESVLKYRPTEILSKMWFECKGRALPWTIPLGVLYDSHHLVKHGYPEQFNENFINIWEIKLRYSKELPSNVIPLINGEEQVRKFVMHQWKQSCFILNGSSKQVMSLSVSDTDKLWTGMLGNDISSFNEVAKRIIPKTPRRVPLVVIDTRIEPLQIRQPNMEDIPFTDFLTRCKTDRVLCQGIELGAETGSLFDIYKAMYSFDGYLYVVIK